MMQFQALCSLGIISLLLNGWVTPLYAYALPQTKSNYSVPLENGESGNSVWDSIVPSSELVWHQCYGDFQCARLQVPLDYSAEHPDEGHAYIAIIKYSSDPVDYPEYSESWGGPILFNPGGPGGPGVGFILEAANDLREMVGPQYSLIGFDPRGVNHTRPSVSCFNSSYDRLLFSARGGGRIMGSGGGEEVGEIYVRGKLLGNICTTGDKAKDAQHLGTVNVARDVITINKAIWDLAPKEVHRKGLQYWGYSYGSVIGITTATLFPDKIERMIVDGVVDVIDYFSGERKKLLTDTELVMDTFYEFCFKAGPVRCQFYTGSKPEHIQERLDSLLEALRTQPLPYSISPYRTSQTELFTYSHLRYLIAVGVMTPLQTFEPLAEFLVLLESSLERGYLDTDPGARPPLTCPRDTFADPYNTVLQQLEAHTAILCSDYPLFTNLTLVKFRQDMERLQEQSPTLGNIVASRILPCIGWMPETKEHPPNFGEAKHTKWEGAPILFVGNTLDPATPLSNAYSMAKLFPTNASAVMVQEGEGHCSFAVPSDCMFSAIRTYLATGKAPPEDKRYCSRVETPFFGTPQGRSETPDTMRRIGRSVHRTTPIQPRALSLAPFS